MKLLQRYFRVLILVLSMGLILGSCSSHGLFDKRARSERLYVAKQYKKGSIDIVDYETVKNNISSYEEKGFIKAYWPAAVFCLLWCFWGLVTLGTADPDPDRIEPLRLKSAYRTYLFSFPFGSVLELFDGGSPEQIENGDGTQSGGVLLALASLFGIPILILIFWADINYYWNVPTLYLRSVPGVLLACILFINVVIIPIILPVMVSRYNAKRFRHHYENQVILSGGKTRVDLLAELIEDTNRNIGLELDIINNHLAGGVNYQRDVDDGFFSWVKRGVADVFTTGDYSKMLRESAYLEEVKSNYELILSRLNRLKGAASLMSVYLEEQRKAAYRNIYLYKEILSLSNSNVRGKVQTLVQDVVLLKDPNNLMLNESLVQNSDIQETTDLVDTHLFEIGYSVGALVERVWTEDLRDAEKKAEVLIQGVVVAINVVGRLLTINGEVTQKRTLIEGDLMKLAEAISSAQNTILEYQAVIARVMEVEMALNACNKAFVRAYTPIHIYVFREGTVQLSVRFTQFAWVGRRHWMSPSMQAEQNKFIEDLYNLQRLCSDYNKINQNTKINVAHG